MSGSGNIRRQREGAGIHPRESFFEGVGRHRENPEGRVEGAEGFRPPLRSPDRHFEGPAVRSDPRTGVFVIESGRALGTGFGNRVAFVERSLRCRSEGLRPPRSPSRTVTRTAPESRNVRSFPYPTGVQGPHQRMDRRRLPGYDEGPFVHFDDKIPRIPLGFGNPEPRTRNPFGSRHVLLFFEERADSDVGIRRLRPVPPLRTPKTALFVEIRTDRIIRTAPFGKFRIFSTDPAARSGFYRPDSLGTRSRSMTDNDSTRANTASAGADHASVPDHST